MNAFGLLLGKDLRRAWRNPLPWLIHLIVPLCIAALLGAAFGGRSERELLGRIRFAVVDEDQSTLMEFLKGAMNQREAGKHLEPVFLEREAALREIDRNKLSAVIILPKGFMRNYFTGKAVVTLELIKNPAQAWHPAIIEEMMGLTVTALNTLRRTLGAELEHWLPAFEGEADHRQVAELIVKAGDKLERVSRYLDPPLLKPETESKALPKEEGKPFNLFAYMLVGLTAMFLLFIAGTTMTDLLREARAGTLARYHTVRDSMLPFIAAKVFSTWLVLLVGCALTLGGGGLIFGMAWQNPGPLALLAGAYCLFAAGFMGIVVALARTEMRADVLCNMAGMVLGLAGGCAFPAQQLPTFIREKVTAFMPPHWFSEAVRALEFGGTATNWPQQVVLLAGLGLALMGAAAFLLRRQLEQGVRP